MKTASGVDKDEELLRQVHQFYELCSVSVSEEGHIEETLGSLDEWNFDAIVVNEMIGRNALPIIYCRFCAVYDSVGALGIDPELLCNFAKKIQAGYSATARFYGYARGIDMVQSMHYFLLRGMGINWPLAVLDMARFTLFTSALVAHVGNPGYTNEFLIKTRHPRALRYNDHAMTFNHALAYVSQQLYDPETNFMLQWEPGQSERFRSQIILSVMKLELKRHFSELSELNTRLSTDSNFPTDSIDDRNALNGFLLRACDMSWAARPNNVFTRWSERFMDELFRQGDEEKKIGITVSTFCDRDVTVSVKVQLARLLLIVCPFLSAFALIYEQKQWPGAKELQKELIDEGEALNRHLLFTKMNKEPH